jgi:hypothetical protein
MKTKKTVTPLRAVSTKSAQRVVRPRRAALPVQYLFNFYGNWVAFRIGKYVFHSEGNCIGWLPWNDADAVDVCSSYLGTIFLGNGFYRRFDQVHRGHPGYPEKPRPSRIRGVPRFRWVFTARRHGRYRIGGCRTMTVHYSLEARIDRWTCSNGCPGMTPILLHMRVCGLTFCCDRLDYE